MAARPVWQGRGGWLFDRGDLIARFDPGVPVRPDLERVVRALEAQGVTLVAVVLPTRGSVYGDKLDRRKSVFAGYDAAAARASYRAFLDELRAAGVLAPDLTEAVHSGNRPFFFARDQHWTSAGARRAAGAVARLLRPLPAYGDLTKTRFRTRLLGRAEQKGWLQERAESLCGTPLPNETVEVFSTDRETTDLAVKEALFADLGPPPVALVGTSNSKRLPDKPESNFSGFLREALNLEVLNAAFAGAGIYGSLLPYLRSDDFRAHKPAFIVWETLIWDWHNRPSLAAEQRQLVPTIYGACAPEAALLRGQTDAGGRQSFTLLRNSRALPLRGRDHFVYLEVEDRTLVNFDLTLSYTGAQQETIPFTHSTRVSNSGRFFLELSSTLPGNLERVSLSAQRPVTGTVAARICRLPSAPR